MTELIRVTEQKEMCPGIQQRSRLQKQRLWGRGGSPSVESWSRHAGRKGRGHLAQDTREGKTERQQLKGKAEPACAMLKKSRKESFQKEIEVNHF